VPDGRRDAPEDEADLRTVPPTSPRPDDAAAAGASLVARTAELPPTHGCGTPALAGGEALPDELRSLADAILVAQQRLSALRCAPARRVQLSRALRRAIELGRRDPSAGRARLAALLEDLPGRGPTEP
jgi:hypothetical protein